MENELKYLPLRSVPADYADGVMAHIACSETKQAHWLDVLIGVQMAITGMTAIVLVALFSADVAPLFDSAVEIWNAALYTLEQFFSDSISMFDAIRIEPLENLAPLEWTLMVGIAAVVWLAVNGLLIRDMRKEKLL